MLVISYNFLEFKFNLAEEEHHGRGGKREYADLHNVFSFLNPLVNFTVSVLYLLMLQYHQK